jgi:integrase
MMAKRKRYIRSPHRGVVLIRRKLPSGGSSWRARWKDPKTGKLVYLTLDPLELTTADARKDWAIAKSAKLAKERQLLSLGEEPAEETKVKDAVKEYLERRGREVKDTTIEAYRRGVEYFRDWLQEESVRFTQEIEPPHLARFRAALVARVRRRPVMGGTRGQRALNGKEGTRSPLTVNRDLRAVVTMLNDWRRIGIAPDLGRDTIRDNLRAAKSTRPVLEFLRGPELRKLLQAALRHDAKRFDLTRDEAKGKGEPGTSPRFETFAPFIVAVLLTGGRFGEIAGLQWDEVNLEAEEILLDADRTKTGHGRRVDLSPTPGLKAVLAAMHLQKGRKPFVFRGAGAITQNTARVAARRLARDFGAPEFTWQQLRRTCGTHLTCAPGIYGAASAFLSAKRLGHSVAVAEKHYVGAVTNIPVDAKTLEEAMGITDLVGDVARVISSGEQAASRAKEA